MTKNRKRKHGTGLSSDRGGDDSSQVKRTNLAETDSSSEETMAQEASNSQQSNSDVERQAGSVNGQDTQECNTQELNLLIDDTPTASPSEHAEKMAKIDIMSTNEVAESGETHKNHLQCPTDEYALNIAVASRALFFLDEENDVYIRQGLTEYIKHMTEREHIPLETGCAFPFVQALEHVNSCLREINSSDENMFNIILMSHNHAHMAVRLFRSIDYHGLNIQKMCLTAGATPVQYLKAYNIKLLLTSYPNEVENALAEGFAAATMLEQKVTDPVRDQLRIAFDLHAVLFSDDCPSAETIAQNKQQPDGQSPTDGPLKEFVSALGRIQRTLCGHDTYVANSPLRTYLVTSRSSTDGERALKKLRSWGLEIDELHFLSGSPIGPVISTIRPHIFFEDTHK